MAEDSTFESQVPQNLQFKNKTLSPAVSVVQSKE